MGTEKEKQERPRVGVFYCGGAMSSCGELTHAAVLEASKRLGPLEVGAGCLAALATGVPKHLRTVQSMEKILVIDGCANACARKIVEQSSLRMDGYINLATDLKIKKIGPFQPLAYSQEDLELAVEAIIAKVKELEGEREVVEER